MHDDNKVYLIGARDLQKVLAFREFSLNEFRDMAVHEEDLDWHLAIDDHSRAKEMLSGKEMKLLESSFGASNLLKLTGDCPDCYGWIMGYVTGLGLEALLSVAKKAEARKALVEKRARELARKHTKGGAIAGIIKDPYNYTNDCTFRAKTRKSIGDAGVLRKLDDLVADARFIREFEGIIRMRALVERAIKERLALVFYNEFS